MFDDDETSTKLRPPNLFTDRYPVLVGDKEGDGLTRDLSIAGIFVLPISVLVWLFVPSSWLEDVAFAVLVYGMSTIATGVAIFFVWRWAAENDPRSWYGSPWPAALISAYLLAGLGWAVLSGTGVWATHGGFVFLFFPSMFIMGCGLLVVVFGWGGSCFFGGLRIVAYIFSLGRFFVLRAMRAWGRRLRHDA